ncbi:small-conductance mechanosensitive channel [Paraperlucidibaca baekdonensis]|uniref:Small-conductance mechanosensitive channel n=1 Tax=Paraperlucidibaca baekdonensis TaxID=748120 RepID=A0A3E0H4Z1_9GAMM|nr:mechanosensitive ion channel family protein [Paraperlucidibaca baekdonensis]REH37700.1 small-conductance mechanosensitive channel [Paraperlucidibaca baekdonensis]
MLDLSQKWLGNTLEEWAYALALALSINVILGLIKWVIITRGAKLAARTSSNVDDALIEIAKRTKQFLILGVTLMIGTRYLELSDQIDKTLITVATVSGFLQLGLWLNGGLSFWIETYRSKNSEGAAATSLGAVYFIGKILLWAIVSMLMLDNLGVDVTALVAGLGVGGIAVALALQNILGDLFASLSIVIDKPFVIGDTILVDTYFGTVEHVGLKTTRLRSVTGEQIIVSNSDLLKTRIRNYKRMEERRMLFTFGVTYQTPAEQLRKIPAMVQEMVESVPSARFNRAHFRGFGDSSLDFEVVYWMTEPDYAVGLGVQQDINLALFTRFEEEGIEFAYPTQTLFVQPQSSEPLHVKMAAAKGDAA